MDPEILKARLQKLLATFQYPYRNDNIEYPVSVTLGAAIYPHDGTDYATLLEHADCALYEAKENGKKQTSAVRTALVSFKNTVSAQVPASSAARLITRNAVEAYFDPNRRIRPII